MALAAAFCGDGGFFRRLPNLPRQFRRSKGRSIGKRAKQRSRQKQKQKHALAAGSKRQEARSQMQKWINRFTRFNLLLYYRYL